MDKHYLAQFQILGTSVKTLKIVNDFIAIPDTPDIKRCFDISHSITSVDISEDDNTLSGLLLLNIKLKLKDTVHKKKYNLDLSIEGCFEAPLEMGEDRFRQMLRVNGVTSLYSISRAFIHSVSAQTLVSGSIILPMINVLEYSKDLDCEADHCTTDK